MNGTGHRAQGTGRKPYARPEVKKVEVDSQIIRMFTRQGFIEVFWEELCEQRKINSSISKEKVFDELNSKFYSVFQEFRYSSYESFRRRLNE